MLVLPGRINFLVYIDDCLLLSPSDKLINQGNNDLCTAEPHFNMEDQGSVNDFLGIKVKHKNCPHTTTTHCILPQRSSSKQKQRYHAQDTLFINSSSAQRCEETTNDQ